MTPVGASEGIGALARHRQPVGDRTPPSAARSYGLIVEVMASVSQDLVCAAAALVGAHATAL
jgi:hypothetical protein